MPNDTLDEIEARWKGEPRLASGPGVLSVSATPTAGRPLVSWPSAKADIRTLIEMVRARDRVVDAARWVCKADHTNGEIHKAQAALDEALSAIGTPPAQEQKR